MFLLFIFRIKKINCQLNISPALPAGSLIIQVVVVIKRNTSSVYFLEML